MNFLDPALESLAKAFEEDITDERGERGNPETGSGKNIFDRPCQTPPLPHTGALKFAHQQIGVKEKDDKAHFDHRSPDIFLHGKYRLLRLLRLSRSENAIASLPPSSLRTENRELFLTCAPLVQISDADHNRRPRNLLPILQIPPLAH
jgi:hypothetical protein